MNLKSIPAKSPLILSEDPQIERYQEDTMMRGNAEAVLRARDMQEIAEVLIYCHAEKIPVTFCGSQTSMTGASVAESGLLISTENLTRVLDVGKGYAVAEPGVTVSDLKKAVAEAGWFYPPAPTSQDDARIGATVSTNATGEDSFQYGSTRKYIREIKVLLADGTQKVFSRKPDEVFSDNLNRAGYFPNSPNPIDLFIGAEGTLGFIYEVRVDLVPEPPGFFSALAPFPSWENAIAFVSQAVLEGKLKARALELVDHGAMDIMKTHPLFPPNLADANAMIYFKQEYHDDAELESLLTEWLALIERYSPPTLTQNILVATTDKQKEEIRKMRHHIPATINETWRVYRGAGGGKVGSDWWVPVGQLQKMMHFVYFEGGKTGLPFLAFAHIGRGHPHVNYLCKNADERKRAEQMLLQCCRRAVALGGGVAGEHGIGKLHRDLVPIQWPREKIEWMQKVKKEYDPRWILGRGNILEAGHGL